MSKIIHGKIKGVFKTYALIETSLGIGICHISNFSDYKINNLMRFIEIYNPTKFAIININDNNHTLDLSFKECNPVFAFPSFKLCHCSSGFTKLKQYVYHLAYLESKKIRKD